MFFNEAARSAIFSQRTAIMNEHGLRNEGTHFDTWLKHVTIVLIQLKALFELHSLTICSGIFFQCISYYDHGRY